jgi:helicase MOV-10
MPRPGDRILVQRHGGPPGQWYEGGVHVVRKEEVGLRFHASFRGWSKTQLYKVRFKLNRYPLRRQHQALDTAFVQDRLLLPPSVYVHVSNTDNFDLRLRCYNKLVAANSYQLQAVSSIVQQKPGSVPFVVFGP